MAEWVDPKVERIRRRVVLIFSQTLIAPGHPTSPVSPAIRPYPRLLLVIAQPTDVCGFDSPVRPAFPASYRAPVCATDPRGSQLFKFYWQSRLSAFFPVGIKSAGGIPPRDHRIIPCFEHPWCHVTNPSHLLIFRSLFD